MNYVIPEIHIIQLIDGRITGGKKALRVFVDCQAAEGIVWNFVRNFLWLRIHFTFTLCPSQTDCNGNTKVNVCVLTNVFSGK